MNDTTCMLSSLFGTVIIQQFGFPFHQALVCAWIYYYSLVSYSLLLAGLGDHTVHRPTYLLEAMVLLIVMVVLSEGDGWKGSAQTPTRLKNRSGFAKKRQNMALEGEVKQWTVER